MDLTGYTIDQVGAVDLSDELKAWAEEGNCWRRYWLYHRVCREAYEKAHGGPPPGTPDGRVLSEKGVLVADRIIDPTDCETFSQAFSDSLENKFGRLEGLDKTVFTLQWNHRRGALLRELLPQIFSPERSAAIENYFGAYFQIIGVSLNRYFPSKERDISFLWHRDCEPPQQLHLMVYLTGASDKGGRTEALNIEATRRAAEAGYSYPYLDSRTSDLDTVFGGSAEGTFVYKPDLEPGGGMLFAAPRNLHRGVLPSEGWRDTMLFLVIPSPIPWDQRVAVNFPTILRNGPHINCSNINPFGRFSPWEEGPRVVPEWAQLSYLEPLDGSLPC